MVQAGAESQNMIRWGPIKTYIFYNYLNYKEEGSTYNICKLQHITTIWFYNFKSPNSQFCQTIQHDIYIKISLEIKF